MLVEVLHVAAVVDLPASEAIALVGISDSAGDDFLGRQAIINCLGMTTASCVRVLLRSN